MKEVINRIAEADEIDQTSSLRDLRVSLPRISDTDREGIIHPLLQVVMLLLNSEDYDVQVSPTIVFQ
jgi:hypothetical protein